MTLLPTPAVNDMGAAYTPEEWDEWTAKMQAAHGNGNGHGKSLSIEAQRLLPTPTAAPSEHSAETSRRRMGSGVPVSVSDAVLSIEARLLPTPTTTQRGTDANLDTREGARANLHNEVANLLPTPSVADVQGGRKSRSGDRSDELLLNGIAHEQRWGDYAPAIARWEALTRPAPDPTEPGAKGSPRLSAAFVEWLMGLPEGHITDPAIGLTRNEQLKAAGNGVVPAQAAAATQWWLAQVAADARRTA